MVQIDNSAGSDGSDTLRSPFEMSGHGQQQQSHAMLENDPNYPTYYNLDQNRMCATPHSGYSNMSAQSIGSGPFSPSIPSGKTSGGAQAPPEMRSTQQQQGCVKMENNVETDDGSSLRGSSASLRFQQSKQLKVKEVNCFGNNGSVSTDTCSNESLTGTIAPVTNTNKSQQSSDLLGQTETNHDGSFRSSETTRDSIKSSDSEGLSSTYGVSQASTPTGGVSGSSSGPWKMSATAAATSEFRQAIGNSFATSTSNNNQTPNNTSHGKLWWAENGQNMSLAARGSFVDCGQYGNYAGNAQAAASAVS